MIDVHCHILPGIDDGAHDLTESLALLSLAQADGIRKMVATPHINPGYFDTTPERIRTALSSLKVAAQQSGLTIELAAAAEVRLCAEIPLWAEQGQLPFLGRWQGSDVLLLEFPHSHIPPGADKLVQWLLKRNIRCMIAHPERNRDVQADPRVLQPFLRAECLFQLTASSLLGDLGSRHQGCAEQLVRQGLYHVMASDSHNLQRRPPKLTPARQRLQQLVGDEIAMQWVSLNPERLTSAYHFDPQGLPQAISG